VRRRKRWSTPKLSNLGRRVEFKVPKQPKEAGASIQERLIRGGVFPPSFEEAFGLWVNDPKLSARERDWILALMLLEAGAGSLPATCRRAHIVARSKTKLIEIMRSDPDISRDVRLLHLADLIERYDFKEPRNRRRRPSYAPTPSLASVMKGVALVRGSVEKGMSVRDACDKHAKEAGVSVETLAAAYGGRLGALERFLKRLRPRPSKTSRP
jgi:hypothetical protein